MRILKVLLAAAFSAAASVAIATPAAAYPACSVYNPYPSSIYTTCTGVPYQECARNICAYPPGTPGQFDINGRYEPCSYRNGCGS